MKGAPLTRPYWTTPLTMYLTVSTSTREDLPLLSPSSSNASLNLRSVLPVEVLDGILGLLDRTELLACAHVNSCFYGIATRLIYHCIEDLGPVKSVKCLKQLASNKRVQPLVRVLGLDWTDHVCPTGNLYRIVARALRSCTNLTHISIEFPRNHAPFWILDDCRFKLKHFATSMPCKPPLAQFLTSQPTITELTLRGFDAEVFVPSFLASPSTTSHRFQDFPLPDDALPNLSSLRTVHGGPDIITTVVRNRPIQAASIALFPDRATESLCALELGRSQMRRLSIMSFDPAAPHYLLSELADRFPHLEALHIVILLSEYTNTLLRESGPKLAGFKKLQYITFMAATDDHSTAEEEKDIAKLWHQSCPTLKTIILPRGRVWFGVQGEADNGGRWSTIEDDNDTPTE